MRRGRGRGRGPRVAFGFLAIRTVLVVASATLVSACGSDLADLPPPPAEIPAEWASAAAAFERHCAGCHGVAARGTETGPPLVHPYYVPSHHGDAAFRLAVRRGVVGHHWRFGDMPAQPQVTDAELDEIVPFVRWLQREAGIN